MARHPCKIFLLDDPLLVFFHVFQLWVVKLMSLKTAISVYVYALTSGSLDWWVELKIAGIDTHRAAISEQWSSRVPGICISLESLEIGRAHV